MYKLGQGPRGLGMEVPQVILGDLFPVLVIMNFFYTNIIRSGFYLFLIISTKTLKMTYFM